LKEEDEVQAIRKHTLKKLAFFIENCEYIAENQKNIHFSTDPI